MNASIERLELRDMQNQKRDVPGRETGSHGDVNPYEPSDCATIKEDASSTDISGQPATPSRLLYGCVLAVTITLTMLVALSASYSDGLINAFFGGYLFSGGIVGNAPGIVVPLAFFNILGALFLSALLPSFRPKPKHVPGMESRGRDPRIRLLCHVIYRYTTTGQDGDLNWTITLSVDCVGHGANFCLDCCVSAFDWGDRLRHAKTSSTISPCTFVRRRSSPLW